MGNCFKQFNFNYNENSYNNKIKSIEEMLDFEKIIDVEKILNIEEISSNDKIIGDAEINKLDEKMNIAFHTLKMSNKYTVNYPNHEKRKTSSIYRKTHYELCHIKNLPCFICGKTKINNISLETHHFYCEKAAQKAIDWIQFGKFAKNCYNIQSGDYFGDKFDWNEVENNPDIFVDSVYNMIVLCKEHHISGRKGIHHVPFPNWILQKYPKNGFKFLEDE